jgi:hypothetical protein
LTLTVAIFLDSNRDQSTWRLGSAVKGITLEDVAETEPPLAVIVVACGSAYVDGAESGADDDGEASVPGFGFKFVHGVEIVVDLASFEEADGIDAFSEERREPEDLAFVSPSKEPVLGA